MLVEAEIQRKDIQEFCFDVVPDSNGRTHHDMWVSMMGISHFNLGVSLELMLKLHLVIGKIPLEIIPQNQRHSLPILYDNLPDDIRKRLDNDFRLSVRYSEKIELIGFIIPKPEDQKPSTVPERTQNVFQLRGLLEYLDEVVFIWQKRYSWEDAELGRWRHYISNFSVVVEFIDRVMRQIPRTELSTLD